MNRGGRGGRGVTHGRQPSLRVLCGLCGSMVLPLWFSVSSVISVVAALAAKLAPGDYRAICGCRDAFLISRMPRFNRRLSKVLNVVPSA